MKRYIRIYFLLLKLNFSSLLAYRANMINSLLSSLTWGGFSIAAMVLLTSRVNNVYGWSREELLLLTGIYSIFIGVFHMLFSKNFERFSQVIHFGELDFILTKPADSQYLLSVWLVNYTSIFRILIGILFTFFIIIQYKLQITVSSLIVGVFFFIVGIIVLYSFWYLASTIIIWYSRLSNLAQLLYYMNGVSRYPKEIFLEFGNFFLYFFLPLTLVINTPTRILLKKDVSSDIFIALFLAIALFFLSRIFWKFALRYYASASS